MQEQPLNPRLRAKRLLWFRILLTVIAWVAFIAYTHHLSHLHLGGIKAALGSTTAQMAAQIVILSGLVYFIMLSLPFLPNLGARGFCVLTIWSGILVLGHQLSHEGFHQLRDNLLTTGGGIGIYGLALVAVLYVLALALPFVPGIEIGLLLMVLFGRDGVIVAYVATISGLSLAYLAAQAMPKRVSLRCMKALGLSEATNNPKDALSAFIVGDNVYQGVTGRLVRLLASYRYPLLAVSMNLPGNSILGGGGGIAALCGMSGQFRWWPYLFTLIAATAPLPLLVLFGQVEIEPLLERHGILHDLLNGVASIFLHE